MPRQCCTAPFALPCTASMAAFQSNNYFLAVHTTGFFFPSASLLVHARVLAFLFELYIIVLVRANRHAFGGAFLSLLLIGPWAVGLSDQRAALATTSFSNYYVLHSVEILWG